jgi:hypothetical protein
MWGMNWHRPSDSLIGLTIDGTLFALDRSTGRPTAAPFALPCSPAKGNPSNAPPQLIVSLGNAQTDAAFGKLPDGRSVFQSITDVIFGGGFCVSNYFASDPHTGGLYVAATAHDSLDGTSDGVSEDGALYLLHLERSSQGGGGRQELAEPPPFTFTLSSSALFPGGTGSTPTTSADAAKVYLSDDQHNVICMDAQLKRLWSLNVGEQVLLSLLLP